MLFLLPFLFLLAGVHGQSLGEPKQALELEINIGTITVALVDPGTNLPGGGLTTSSVTATPTSAAVLPPFFCPNHTMTDKPHATGLFGTPGTIGITTGSIPSSSTPAPSATVTAPSFPTLDLPVISEGAYMASVVWSTASVIVGGALFFFICF
ncbi:uncharacterized protein B0I36DRAFT_383901 [Microdochium trichocladiopsis]|uniref:Uncharacterized protein n=1 Tax=Microdochium trichocladiopsis TaxID=1682393 RepID=A0A9P8Y8Q1_9PEZI|nr:uncharacterized protein B0I36DRAFT_383901 [Microdochium trichocladiopsis]KAH7031026.1 hypothetical protein B0I36DRAFT_383901 [Microdochium trichocladiopsis]